MEVGLFSVLNMPGKLIQKSVKKVRYSNSECVVVYTFTWTLALFLLYAESRKNLL